MADSAAKDNTKDMIGMENSVSESDPKKLIDLSLPKLKDMHIECISRLKELRHVVKAKAEIPPQVQLENARLEEKRLHITNIIEDREAQETRAVKGHKALHQMYGKIKKTVFSLYFTYKGEVLDDLEDDIACLIALQSELDKAYNEFRMIRPPDNEIRRKVDSGIQMCTDLIKALQCIEANPLMPAETRKEILKKMCGQDYSRSVFGSCLDKASEQSHSLGAPDTQDQDARSVHSHNSRTSEKSRKLVELEAKKRRADLKAQALQHEAALSNIQEQLAIVNLEERVKREELSNEPEIKDQAPNSFSIHNSQKLQGNSQTSQAESQLSFIAQEFSDSINKSRLPVPIPPVFDGNPLKFINFKKSFVALVESKGIPPADKLYYLQQYLTGEAKAAVEGCFFGSDNAAYGNAWERLEKRFGHPFKIQQSLRDKLKAWPKVPPDNSKAFQDFGDFLHTLQEAMPYVDGLKVLDDYVQIQDIAAKLPHWCNNRWTRLVTTTMNEGNSYPSFATFVSFVNVETQVATNPICAASQNQRHTPQVKTNYQYNSRRANGLAHAISTDEGSPIQHKESSFVSCSFCASKQHLIGVCTKFNDLSHEKKIKFIREKHLCFKCLYHGHPSKWCQNKIVCHMCKKNHHTMLHLDYYVKPEKKTSSTKIVDPKAKCSNPDHEVKRPSTVEGISNKAQSNMVRGCTSMILPVWLKTGHSGSQEILTYALVDTQSDNSYISEDLADRLSIPYKVTRMQMKTMNQVTTTDCRKFENISLRGFDMSIEVNIESVFTTAHIPYSRNHIPSKVEVSKMPHLAAVAPHIPPIQDCEAGLLIGYNCPRALRPVEIVQGSPEDAFAVKTDLGWSVVGGTATQEGSGFCHRTSAKELLAPPPGEIIRLLDQDFTDTKDDIVYSQEDLMFLKTLEKGIRINDKGKLSMPLPLKNKATLPNNHSMALSRLNSLKRKLTKDDKFATHYCNFMQQMIDKGHAEKVQPPLKGEVVNYIPHQGVYHPHKPDKIRVVFDGSAKYQGISLNDVLLKGPDLMNGLLGVLLRFRQDKVALICDIEQMFYNFEVNREHRNLLRFLWWPGGDLSLSPAEYQITVHLFGAASSPGCANYGLKYLAECYEKTYPQGAAFLKRNLYMDDGLCSLSTKEQAIDLIKQATKICQQGNIRLHKFLSNSKEVLESIPSSERITTVSELDLKMESLPVERTLGIKWDAQQDCFLFTITLKDSPNTRRGILSSVMSVYDPNGFVSPVVLEGKRILQSLCRQKKSWDEPVENAIAERWERWKSDLYALNTLKIPRGIKPDKVVDRYELHHFSDASTTGYGQCSYVRMHLKDGSISCTLLMSKARVAPFKVVSIPRLELTAAALSVKISKLLKRELEIPFEEEYFWTDSKVVLGYIANDARRFHVFVSNRVQYIRDNTETYQWHYVPTKSNPADIASRGISAQQLNQSMWIQGPDFLLEKRLPLKQQLNNTLSLGDPEVRVQCTATLSTATSTGLLDRLNRFSN